MRAIPFLLVSVGVTVALALSACGPQSPARTSAPPGQAPAAAPTAAPATAALPTKTPGTFTIATHEMGFARQVADRVCFLDRGRLLEVGPPAQVLEAPCEPRTREFLHRISAAQRVASDAGALAI